MKKIFFLLLFLISFSTSAHDSGRVHEVENQLSITSSSDESIHTHLSFDGIFESSSFSFYASGSQSLTLQSDGNVRLNNLGSGVVKSDGSGVLSFEAIKTGFNKDFGTIAGTVSEGDHTHGVVISSKAGSIAGSSFFIVSGKMVYDVIFSTAFPDTEYAISIVSTAQRTWTYENKASTGFRINANSNSPLTGDDVSWQAIESGEN